MKKRVQIVALLTFFASSITVFAQDIKVHINESVKYISIEEFTEGLSGTITSEGGSSIVEISYNTLEIENGYSFIKKNDEYLPVDTEVVDGYVVPKDTKVYEEGSNTYLPLNFIKENIVGDYTILEDKVVFESPEVEEIEEEVEQEEDVYVPPTRPGSGTNTGGGSSGGTSPEDVVDPDEDNEEDQDLENPDEGNNGPDEDLENPDEGNNGSGGDNGDSGDGSEGSDGNSGNEGEGSGENEGSNEE